MPLISFYLNCILLLDKFKFIGHNANFEHFIIYLFFLQNLTKGDNSFD